MTRIITQTQNALARAGITNPETLSIQDLLKVPGIGPLSIHSIAVQQVTLNRKIKKATDE